MGKNPYWRGKQFPSRCGVALCKILKMGIDLWAKKNYTLINIIGVAKMDVVV